MQRLVLRNARELTVQCYLVPCARQTPKKKWQEAELKQQDEGEEARALAERESLAHAEKAMAVKLQTLKAQSRHSLEKMTNVQETEAEMVLREKVGFCWNPARARTHTHTHTRLSLPRNFLPLLSVCEQSCEGLGFMSVLVCCVRVFGGGWGCRLPSYFFLQSCTGISW
jgi:hypothetical protein